MADITIHNGGSIFMFTPNTPDATAWVDANLSLESWQWMGESFAVEYRYAGDLASAMIDDGLTVE